MFNTLTGIKRSFYSQTGDFQFNFNLLTDSLFGKIDFGISGINANGAVASINYSCVSGKIFDNNNLFLGNYTANQEFNVSGNVNSGSYDLFINGAAVSYHTTKSTGTYNYLYLKPQNIGVDYELYVNGEQPTLSVTNISCFTGAALATGYIVNSGLTVKIYSGSFTNFSANMPLYLYSMFSGDLNKNSSGAYYVAPQTGESLGLYTGNLELITNGGILTYPVSINITGSPIPVNYSISLDGLSAISTNYSQQYISNITCSSGSGIPIVVSLEYLSGSGNFYGNIPVFSGYTHTTATGFIRNTGVLTGFVSGIGTGIGGYYNNIGTGLVTGRVTGLGYSTGLFTWPYSLIVTGYATGDSFSGNATGLYNTIVTGIILNGSGTYRVNDYFTGNKSPLFEDGGFQELITEGPITGYINTLFSGSGFYTGFFNGTISGSGTVLDYAKTFTGSWGLKTGIPFQQFDYFTGGRYNAAKTKYLDLTHPVYYIDSTLFINVTYTNNFDGFRDVALLTVSGLSFNTGQQILITGSY